MFFVGILATSWHASQFLTIISMSSFRPYQCTVFLASIFIFKTPGCSSCSIQRVFCWMDLGITVLILFNKILSFTISSALLTQSMFAKDRARSPCLTPLCISRFFCHRQLFHGSCSTTAVTRQLFHGSCSTAAVPRQLFHGSCFTAAVSRQLFHGSCSTAALTSSEFLNLQNHCVFFCVFCVCNFFSANSSESSSACPN